MTTLMHPAPPDFPDHFETERLLMRAPRPTDGDLLYEAVLESVDNLKPWMPWAHQPVTREGEAEIAQRMAANFLKREDLPFYILDKVTGKFIGGTGLHRFDWGVPRFEIGYWARASCEGKGYITEASAGIARFAFETLKAERVEIHMDDDNVKSWRVAERLHFKLEGVRRRDARKTSGELRDTRVYSMIRSEWLGQEAARTMSGSHQERINSN